MIITDFAVFFTIAVLIAFLCLLFVGLAVVINNVLYNNWKPVKLMMFENPLSNDHAKK